MLKHKAGKVALSLVVALALAALGFVVVSGALSDERRAGPVREIVISAKDYRFNESNPTIVLKPGERVRLVVRNDETDADGTRHDFRVVGTGARCTRPLQPGETEIVEFTVPESGELAYTCCAHPGMGGKILISEDAPGAPAAGR